MRQHFVIGAILSQKGNDLLSNGKKADAIAFKNNFKQGNDGHGYFYPVVRFLTEKQEWIIQELSIGYSPEKAEGTKVEVICDPENPTNVEINSSLQPVILPRLFVTIGVAGIAFGTLASLEVINF